MHWLIKGHEVWSWSNLSWYTDYDIYIDKSETYTILTECMNAYLNNLFLNHLLYRIISSILLISYWFFLFLLNFSLILILPLLLHLKPFRNISLIFEKFILNYNGVSIYSKDMLIYISFHKIVFFFISIQSFIKN